MSKVIDGLVRLGAEVVHSGIEDVHATGHAKQEELKTLLSIAQPEWFTPVHGEYRHLIAHARLARSMGMRRRARARVRGRRPARCSPTTASTRGREVPAGYLYVDGIVGDVGQGVLRDRRVLAEEGVVVVVVTVDMRQRRDHHRTRGHHPRLGVRARGRGPARRVRATRCARRVQGGVRLRATRSTSRRCSGSCGRPRASSSTTGRAGGR